MARVSPQTRIWTGNPGEFSGPAMQHGDRSLAYGPPCIGEEQQKPVDWSVLSPRLELTLPPPRLNLSSSPPPMIQGTKGTEAPSVIDVLV
ncbi:unnamed protein product [Lota lota]